MAFARIAASLFVPAKGGCTMVPRPKPETLLKEYEEGGYTTSEHRVMTREFGADGREAL